ncbi:uncharacterized protein HfgLR_12140 [Haloferax gibbonsii]|uniref:Uncharacterized protein n=1 Tax=Haloferax gibbonsii TaxID=35746 RepID=A0A871BIG1_HALGI|nr:hypothetical protein [Haloferax gibbonsii]QOS12565.1 uncharacterized protein HfgLR_12140 [Haloferax gibbonsii]
MSDAPNRDPLRRTAVVVVVSLAVAALVTWFGPDLFVPHKPGGPGGPPIPDLFVQLKLFVSTYNLVALGFLAATYAMLYRELPNRFTLSLLLFTAALLLYALTSNPLASILLGFRGSGLGPFTFLPDLFAAVAVTFLTYQSSA